MITLSSTTDKIQVLLGSTVLVNELSCYAAYRDTTVSSISPINFQSLTNGITPVDLVGSPSSSTQRLVEYISVTNSDTTANTVTIRFSDNGTYYTIFKCELGTGEKIEYKDKKGFEVISKPGSQKKTQTVLTSINVDTPAVTIVPRDVTISPAVLNGNKNSLEVPFGFTVSAGSIYYFRIVGFLSPNATTNGSRINIDVPSVGLSYGTGYYYWNSVSATTWTTSYAITNAGTPTTSSTSSSSTNGSNFLMDGFISSGVDGFARFTIGSEEASPSFVTLKANNRLFYHKVA